MVSALDVFPSLVRLAGAARLAGVGLDGEDLSRALLGKSAARRSRPLFWNRPPDRLASNGEALPDLAMRRENWKLLLARDGRNAQLYDLGKDPGEAHNLAGRHPAVVRKLSEPLLAWWQSLPGSHKAPSQARSRGQLFANSVAKDVNP